MRRTPKTPLFPYTTLFRSGKRNKRHLRMRPGPHPDKGKPAARRGRKATGLTPVRAPVSRVAEGGGRFHVRSEEHTSELQSHSDLVCRLLLEKKKTKKKTHK